MSGRTDPGPAIFPYQVSTDEHGVLHIRKLTTGECVACVEADVVAILEAWFRTHAGVLAR